MSNWLHLKKHLNMNTNELFLWFSVSCVSNTSIDVRFFTDENSHDSYEINQINLYYGHQKYIDIKYNISYQPLTQSYLYLLSTRIGIWKTTYFIVGISECTMV